MKHESYGGLVDLKALNKLVKTADPLVVGRDLWEGGTSIFYIASPYWVVRLRLPLECPTIAAIAKILGTIPEPGTALQCRPKGQPSAFDIEKLKETFRDTFYAECYDTMASVELKDGREVRVFECHDHAVSEKCYITIDREYFNMLSAFRAQAKKAHQFQPILFTANYDECAYIMPVSYNGTPSPYLI